VARRQTLKIVYVVFILNFLGWISWTE